MLVLFREVKRTSSIVVTGEQRNQLALRSPINGSSGEFPFAAGDEIFVENVKTLGDGDGYNSSDYNLKFYYFNYFNL